MREAMVFILDTGIDTGAVSPAEDRGPERCRVIFQPAAHGEERLSSVESVRAVKVCLSAVRKMTSDARTRPGRYLSTLCGHQYSFQQRHARLVQPERTFSENDGDGGVD